MKEIIKKIIKENFGCDINDEIDFEVRKEKIYFFKSYLKNFFNFLKNKGLKLNPIGIYFGKIKQNNKIQLSIEGSQYVGRKATKNIFEINDYKELYEFILGKKIELKNVEKHNFPILKYKDLVICSTASRENEIECLLPKVARKSII
jgi:NOL1/NOP2/fmu family ribosome biogenesis protein